ncbi:hypothetical protein Bca4012_038269 [Brassica carinata]
MIDLHMKLTVNSIHSLNASIKFPPHSRTAESDPFKRSLNDLKGGGGQTWRMERRKHGRGMGAGEMTLDPALVGLRPSKETTKTTRVFGLSIVETRRLKTSHEGATER